MAPDYSIATETATFPGVRVREPLRLGEDDGPSGSVEHLAKLTLVSMRTPRQQALLSGRLWALPPLAGGHDGGAVRDSALDTESGGRDPRASHARAGDCAVV